MSSFLDPYTAVGIGTEVIPPVWAFSSDNEVIDLFPSTFARINNPQCLASVKVWPNKLAGSSIAKTVMVAKYATYDDLVAAGYYPAGPMPSYLADRFLESWLQMMRSTPQNIRTFIEKNIKCAP